MTIYEQEFPFKLMKYECKINCNINISESMKQIDNTKIYY